MSELRIENWTMLVADLGAENPLPFFDFPWPSPPVVEATGGVPAEIARQSQYGRLRGPLPYALQDDYARRRRPRAVRVAVLENDHLRATFLLEYGGRLWSLQDKATGRELLAVNKTLQPANLALRNAWFSGGVEWNVGIIGHSAFTMSPVFAARVETDTGVPVLRLYEWERLRQIPFQIDAFLPDDSRVLFVRVRLINPHREAVPVCWWSNMAVPEEPGVRVIVPAGTAFTFVGDPPELTAVPVPGPQELDYSYPLQVARAGGYYFDIPPERRPWITALDQMGRGVIQTSTSRLRGRTLFTLGRGPGGETWHRFLAPDGLAEEHGRYLEIESGLARSHLEHVPMPPHSEWSWLEAYGPLAADAGRVHGRDWHAAQAAVEEALETLVSNAAFEATERWSASILDRPPQALLQEGSGWGALAQRERRVQGKPSPLSPGLLFPDTSLGWAQAPWLELLEKGSFPELPAHELASFVVEPAWWRRLESAIARGAADNWSGWYHLGIIRLYHGQVDMARVAWERSLSHRATPWALRNLALLAAIAGDTDRAIACYQKALRLAPALRSLITEAGRFFVDAGEPEKWLEMLPTFAPALREDGRIRLLEAQASLSVGKTEIVADFFNSAPIVDDIREGEMSLENLWVDWQTQELARKENLLIEEARRLVWQKRPLPPAFDFNMFRLPDDGP